MLEAVKQGCPCTIKTTPTIADGIAVARAGQLTCEMIRDYVDEIVTVSEDDIARAILFLMEKGKVVAEGAGATPVAALLAGKIKEQGQNICCVISGGNSDINMIERIINKALILEGRKAEFNVVVPDRAGELFKVLQVLAEKANILRINQSMYKTGIKINNQVAKIVIECANAEHRRNEIAVAISFLCSAFAHSITILATWLLIFIPVLYIDWLILKIFAFFVSKNLKNFE